jgi:sugar/nucleoside kinase (ribokinase family)
MAAVICGSLAFDTIMTFEGRFADQILPDQLHILNVSFLVPTLRRDFGGCAGNIAYSLNALGGTALPMATLGSDGAEYVERMRTLGISTEFVRQLGDTYTAQAMIMSDRDNNQITAFHPGAMQQAHVTQGRRARRHQAGHHRARRARRHAAARRAVRRRRHSLRVRSGPGPADVRRRGARISSNSRAGWW